MSISVISSLTVANGGKTALPGSGDASAGMVLPLDFAALLAEQIPVTGLAAPDLPTGNALPANPALDPQALHEIITQAGTKGGKEQSILSADSKQLATHDPGTDDSAAGILAALSPKAKEAMPTASGASTDRDKDHEQKDTKSAEDGELIPPDPAQVAAPLLNLVAPSRSAQRNEGDSAKPSDLASAMISAKDARPDLPELARPIDTKAQPSAGQGANPFAEAHLTQRSDSANPAILAGDANSGNTPAVVTPPAASGSAAAATPAGDRQPAITVPLNEPGWPHDFSNRVVWLAKNDQQVAQININPPQLGPVQISISLNGDQASATFASPHAEVRQAIQDSLPQLREMFTTAGISLGQANVGSQMPSQNREASYQFANEARSSRENAILSPDSHASSAPAGIPIQRGRGLVDLFA